MHHAHAAGISLAALLLASAAHAQQKPQDQDADVEIPAAPRPAPAPPQPPTQAAPPPPAAAAPPPASQASSASAEIEALRREMRAEQARMGAQIDALKAELAARKAAEPATPGQPPTPTNEPTPSGFAGGTTPFASIFGRGAWGISAYVQAQYENHQDSEDQLQQGGVVLNQDRFLVRRGRLRFDAAWKYAELAFELDGSTVRGLNASVRRAQASLVWRGKTWDGQLVSREARSADPPLAMLTVGLTDIPFGYELVDSPRDRVFMERSQASLALFPGERDVGAVLSGGIGFFRYAVAVSNGEPTDERNLRAGTDPNKAKDLVLRLGVDTRPTDSFRIGGGVSALYGRGFHAGTDATKDTIQWTDLNQNGTVESNELVSLPGTAATPSVGFSRWAVGIDLGARFKTKLGWTSLYGEALLATNLDRGLFVADPVTTGIDVRHFGAYGALVQEITPYGLLGFRFDYYDPNADFFDKRGGKLLPSSQSIKTFSPLVGLQLPGHAKLIFQYDVVRDLLTKDAVGVPTDLKNDRFTIRLQVQL
ncbi:phosphate-selective porin O and P [Minicystis rosea]|nr:phosphate-selective porin O and P [Minicystis rosea]